MQLYQVPFSHNCVKVRHVLELKGVAFENVNINPAWRGDVWRASRQTLVPALVDGGRSIAGSTPVLLYLEEEYPEPALLPADPRERAECLLLMDWADATFMALTRRIAYHRVLTGAPGDLGGLFFPRQSESMRSAMGAVAGMLVRLRFGITAKRNRADMAEARRAAAIAVERLGGADDLVGDMLTLADITLAAMSAPLQYAEAEVSEDPAVKELLEWCERILGRNFQPPRVTELAAARAL